MKSSIRVLTLPNNYRNILWCLKDRIKMHNKKAEGINEFRVLRSLYYPGNAKALNY